MMRTEDTQPMPYRRRRENPVAEVAERTTSEAAVVGAVRTRGLVAEATASTG
jgi:hypothetical protein